MTAGRLLLAAFNARATFFDEVGNRVAAVQALGPSFGVYPIRGSWWLSIPTSVVGAPPTWQSHTIAVCASAQSRHRSR